MPLTPLRCPPVGPRTLWRGLLLVLYNPLMHPQPDVPLISIVIPNYNGAACLELCLLSLLQQTGAQAELLVVDNASHDQSVATARRLAPQARILVQERNLGFAAAVNRGIEAARGEWIAVLNNDTEAAPDWLAELAAAIGRHPEASFLASRILDYSDRGRVYSSGDCFLRTGAGYRRGQECPDGEEYRREIPVFSACGCAAFYRRKALEAAGGFDERFFAYMEDVDLGLRLQAAGLDGYYVPSAVVYHVGGATSGGEFAALAVRLRTRNSILMLVKSVPGHVLLRCVPMILAGQLSWLIRATVRGRLLSWVRGLAGVPRLAPAMLEQRRSLRSLWKKDGKQLWRRILDSEDLARRDFLPGRPSTSRFLKWYFRLL